MPVTGRLRAEKAIRGIASLEKRRPETRDALIEAADYLAARDAAPTPEGVVLRAEEREALATYRCHEVQHWMHWQDVGDELNPAITEPCEDCRDDVSAMAPTVERIIAARLAVERAAHEGLLLEARATALHSLADDWQWKDWSDVLIPEATKNPIANGQRVTDWLRLHAALAAGVRGE